MDSNEMIAYLKNIQEKLTPEHAKSDYFANIDDALFLLRAIRNAGYRLERGKTVTGAKSSYWNVYRGDFPSPQFKVMVDTTRSIERGNIIVVPHTEYYSFRPKLEIHHDNLFYGGDWRHRYGLK